MNQCTQVDFESSTLYCSCVFFTHIFFTGQIKIWSTQLWNSALTSILLVSLVGASLIPYGLPCLRELFRFLISLTNPHDRHNTDAMMHMGLQLLTVALESAQIANYQSLLGLVKDELCRHLFQVKYEHLGIRNLQHLLARVNHFAVAKLTLLGSALVESIICFSSSPVQIPALIKTFVNLETIRTNNLCYFVLSIS